jgi:hypothetical protein
LIDEKFEKIKRDAIHAVNTESVFLKPQAISHATTRRDSQEEEEKETTSDPVQGSDAP